MLRNGQIDCSRAEDEPGDGLIRPEKNIFFQIICDGFVELEHPLVINDQNYTDETECDFWPCNNTYTACDGIWNCLNGEDEVNCPWSSCPLFEHLCVSPANNSFFCLPIAKAGDDVVDCLGASDERQLCRQWDPYPTGARFRCRHESKCVSYTALCDGEPQCAHNDDEQFCSLARRSCRYPNDGQTQQEFLCNVHDILKRSYIPFSLRKSRIYPRQPLVSNTKSRSSLIKQRSIATEKNNSFSRDKSVAWVWGCNRGILVLARLKAGDTSLQCLCPPGYYGNLCEYQNQRVSITVQVYASLNWRSTFAMVLTLIDDDEHFINSYYHFDYLPLDTCTMKYNIHLLYATRPKNSSKNYSVQINAFVRHTLEYRASWLFPIRFAFLPVYRMTVQLIIPMKPMALCSLDCGAHGQCLKYNNMEKYFCRCSYGWSGSRCNHQHMCNCSPDSLCVGPSMCLCPLNKIGSRCYINRNLCRPNPCLNNGVCISSTVANSLDSVSCICEQSFSGKRCEFRATQINILFREVTIPSFVIIHFIEVEDESIAEVDPYRESPYRTSTVRKMGIYENSLTIYRVPRFHMIFVELSADYYLTLSQQQYMPSLNISTDVNPSRRCLSISELFNETFVKLHLIRRIKYYHIPCQQRAELVCFYDDTHMCLCNSYQQANCFQFDHKMTYQCRSSDYCENSISCFPDARDCPTTVVCQCLECYYGSRCQFSTQGISLSLDVMLGYHIRPQINLVHQPLITKVTAGVMMLIAILGVCNSLLGIVTFQRTHVQDSASRIYLLISSFSSLATMIIFILKFWLLLFTQMGSIVNRSFLHFNCVYIDYLLRLLLTITDWLNTSVSVERTVAVTKGVSFDRFKSKKTAKWVIGSIVLLTICSFIHDPIHRELFDDEEEQRIWCLTKYSPSYHVLNAVTIYLHSLIPFIINIISAFIIIVMTARQRSNAQKKLSYKQHLRQQFQQHKHLLISTGILIILALPRLIISSLSTCMKSIRDPWLFLAGYLASFIPSTLTSIGFIVPSQTYKKEFKEALNGIRQTFCQR